MPPSPRRVPPSKVYTEAEIREIDRAAIEGRGIPGAELMERAGEAVWEAVLRDFDPSSVTVFCGKGNNGGDGFVVARLAAEAGKEVKVALAAEPSDIRGDALAHFERLPERIKPKAKTSFDDMAEAASEAVLMVDALLGTGVHGAVRRETAEIIHAINGESRWRGVPVVSIDIPSGVPSDAGWDGKGEAIEAAVTVAIGGPKIGSVVEPGASKTGQLVVAPINFPRDLLDADKIQGHLLTREHVASLLPERDASGHKGTFGRCLLAAGSEGLAGAAALCAKGALRGGTGLVHAAVPKAVYSAVLPAAPEAMFQPFGSGQAGFFEGEDAHAIFEASWADGLDAGAIGPGLGSRPETLDFAKRFFASFKKPLLLDADAIQALKGIPALNDQRADKVGITPHPGELARLLGKKVADIQKNRVEAARDAARRLNCHVLLKGARSIIAEPGGRFFVNPTGNTGLAKGGSGDVLTGLIASLLAQGVPMGEALRAGAYVHGLAADLLAMRGSVRSMLPSDVAGAFGEAFDRVEKGWE